ncbi:hypothetical protein, partial [Lentzea sp. NPDC051838]|uniref:hypothetical protein n=1 Tax=Lentzea sp. NPDC051838 TaxID=3154849 RepID=UPI00343B8470
MWSSAATVWVTNAAPLADTGSRVVQDRLHALPLQKGAEQREMSLNSTSFECGSAQLTAGMEKRRQTSKEVDLKSQ